MARFDSLLASQHCGNSPTRVPAHFLTVLYRFAMQAILYPGRRKCMRCWVAAKRRASERSGQEIDGGPCWARTSNQRIQVCASFPAPRTISSPTASPVSGVWRSWRLLRGLYPPASLCTFRSCGSGLAQGRLGVALGFPEFTRFFHPRSPTEVTVADESAALTIELTALGRIIDARTGLSIQPARTGKCWET